MPLLRIELWSFSLYTEWAVLAHATYLVFILFQNKSFSSLYGCIFNCNLYSWKTALCWSMNRRRGQPMILSEHKCIQRRSSTNSWPTYFVLTTGRLNINLVCRIWDSNSAGYEESFVFRCNAVYTVECQLTFRRNMSLKAAFSSETWVCFQRTTRRFISEDRTLHTSTGCTEWFLDMNSYSNTLQGKEIIRIRFRWIVQ
jgi:hypothetical protein